MQWPEASTADAWPTGRALGHDRHMYLIHVRIKQAEGAVLPPDIIDLVRASARVSDGLEHVAVHRGADSGPILGLFLLAPSLEPAERAAADLCRRMLRQHASRLTGLTLAGCSVAMPTAYYEKLLSQRP